MSVAMQLVHLNLFYTKVCSTEAKQLRVLLQPEYSLEWVFNEMFLAYEEQVKQDINAALKDYCSSPNVSFSGISFWSKAPERQTAITSLFNKLGQLFKEYQHKIALLPQKINLLIEGVIAQVNREHQQGYLGAAGVTKSTLAEALSHFLKDFKQKHGFGELYASSSTKSYGL